MNNLPSDMAIPFLEDALRDAQLAPIGVPNDWTDVRPGDPRLDALKNARALYLQTIMGVVRAWREVNGQ